VCKSFLVGREHLLEDFDAHSFYAPHATSLRLSGLGYSSNAQAGIEVGYNSLQDFVASLRRAIQTPYPEYQKFGVKVDGVYQQLNANLLQIENEFYSVIRPKIVAASGESPSRALKERGVQYVEVRSVDLNPFTPIGIDSECVHFFDLLLLYCLFTESPDIGKDEWEIAADNRHRVVMHGRQPDLRLSGLDREHDFTERATELLNDMMLLAQLLDQVTDQPGYVASVQSQLAKIEDSALTPSARIIRQMSTQNASFFEFAMGMAEQHEKLFKHTKMAQADCDRMKAEAARSHQQQKEIEDNDTLDFDDFLDDYFHRQNAG
jgi:glutamate--cysteine ligase